MNTVYCSMADKENDKYEYRTTNRITAYILEKQSRSHY